MVTLLLVTRPLTVRAHHTQDNDPSLPYPKSLPDASCGYGELTEKEFPGFKLAAVSPKSELKGRAMGGCGTCVEIKCTDKQYCSATTPTQVVMVYDTCDECAAKELNVNARVFGELAPLSMGRIDVQYRQVRLDLDLCRGGV